MQTTIIYSYNISMEFGIEKCTMLAMKKWKREVIEVKELPNLETIRTLGEKENYKYLKILKGDNIKQIKD